MRQGCVYRRQVRKFAREGTKKIINTARSDIYVTEREVCAVTQTRASWRNHKRVAGSYDAETSCTQAAHMQAALA